MLDLFPEASVHYLGLFREKVSLQPVEYYREFHFRSVYNRWMGEQSRPRLYEGAGVFQKIFLFERRDETKKDESLTLDSLLFAHSHSDRKAPTYTQR